ncbi:P-loop containing nucleoside triphosphate hydrolase protein [Trametes punicea]|nr:P-loop containing nucleoside triphosphate hydrolase protein [Trametes punicea]
MKTRVILVGIGGATCSGKTTLAKHLRRILPNSVIVHQDDFAPVKRTGKIPPEHISHDHLNEQKDVPIDGAVFQRWEAYFEQVHRQRIEMGEEVKWVLVDGFLLYWHPEVVDKLDVRIFLRVPHDVLKQRRHERHGYHTAEGSLWRDPPNYWEQIVWPAYVEAHQGILENGDVEHGKPNGKVPGLVLLEGLELSMTDMVDRVCGVLEEVSSGDTHRESA